MGRRLFLLVGIKGTDGRFISFISNRTGRKELYIVKSNGDGKPIQITKDKHNYFHAKWSPYLN